MLLINLFEKDNIFIFELLLTCCDFCRSIGTLEPAAKKDFVYVEIDN